MHSGRKTADVAQRPADSPPVGIYESLRQLRMQKQLQLRARASFTKAEDSRYSLRRGSQ